MSDVAIVAAVALVSATVVAVVWLRQRAATLIRAEQRDERDAGAIAQMRQAVLLCEKRVTDMGNEQRTFLANNRR